MNTAVMMACLRRVAVGSVVVLATAVMGQDGMDDMTDMDSMLAAPSGGDGGGGGSYKKEKELTVIQQTTLALQQLGIVIGLCFILFSAAILLTLVADVTLADEDTKSILTDNANRAIQVNVAAN